LISTDLNHKLF